MTSSLEITGMVFGRIRDRWGSLVHQFYGKNLITTLGKEEWAKAILNTTSTTRVLGAALGTSTLAPAASQTALGAELGSSRVAINLSGTTGNLVQYIFVWTGPVGGFTNVGEIGLFSNATSGGVMFSRFLPGVFSLLQGHELNLAWTLRIG